MSVKVSAPGKLFLSGEWAILEMGNPGLVTAVDKRVHAEIEEAGSGIEISVDDFNIEGVKANFADGKLVWEGKVGPEEEEKLSFMKGAIETTLNYLGGWKPFRIRSWSEMSQITLESGETKKLGFGSSAAAVVATVGGILALNGVDITTRESKDIIYKLSTIAHYFVQGKVGSAFDVAASTYGGVFVYKRFDPDWLVKQVEGGRSIREVAEQEWPGFLVEELDVPEDFILLVGWTKDSASTSEMVKQMNSFRDGEPEEYSRIYQEIGNLVGELVDVWKSGNGERVLELLRKNEDYLRELGKKSGVNIETPELKTLSEAANAAGAAGKLSGSGGGDCGIAVCFSQETADGVKGAWEEAGLHPIDTAIDRDGVRTE